MIETRDIKEVYFVGIGGIGMSAIARYFLAGGFPVSGYDRSETSLTAQLTKEGCDISYIDDINTLPELFRNPLSVQNTLIIYTPAIPAENKLIGYFRNGGYKLYKRSEILGEISEKTDTLAVSGTHGKTTVSTMIAHLLKQSHVDCSAFLGGISKNYNSNLLLGESRYTVMEADEFDRSFHHLRPILAVVTSLDPDHLDIYGDHETMIAAYNEFCAKIRPNGTLIINRKILSRIVVPSDVNMYTYGFEEDADYRSFNITQTGNSYRFDMRTPEKTMHNIHFGFPGIINIENATAAVAVALTTGVTEMEIRMALISFSGVRRRFDIRLDYPGLVYIDDYAHHPEEIKACITSVREYFKGRRITGIFQPHLFSRTRDHAEGFAEILDTLDEAILLPIYPAREKPIEGVSSAMIFEKMKLAKKKLLNKEDIPGKLDIENLDVLLTIGAGDIDKLVDPIEKELEKEERQMKVFGKILIMFPALYLVVMPAYLEHITGTTPCGGIKITIEDSSEYHFVSRREISNLISATNSRIIGKPVRELPLQDLESRISQIKELKEAEVYTTVDGILHISVDQRDPVMRVIAGGGDYFIDEDGILVRSRGLYNPRLHIVEGNIRITGPMLNGVSILDTSIKHTILKDIYQFVEYINNDTFWSAQIDQIFVDNDDEIDLIPRMGNNVIHLGTIGNFDGKLRNLEAFYKKVLPEVGWNKYELINLEYKDQIVCRKR